MFKSILILSLIFSTYEFVNCDGDPHLCRRNVSVPYQEEVTMGYEEFGEIGDILKKLGIKEGKKYVTKYKEEEEEICCHGFIKLESGICEPLPITNYPRSTTDYSESTTINSSTEHTQTASPPPNTKGYLSIPVYSIYLFLVLMLIIILVTVVVVGKIKKRSRECEVKSEPRVIFDAEMQKPLIMM